MPRAPLAKKQQAGRQKDNTAPVATRQKQGAATSRRQADKENNSSRHDTTEDARQRQCSAELDGRAGSSRRPAQKQTQVRSAAARDMEKELERLKKQLESAKRKLQERDQDREDDGQMIPRPKGAGKGRGGIASAMGLDGDEEGRYLYVRMLHDMRTVVDNANVDWSLPYSKQDSERMGRIYKRMRTLFPELRKYQHNWATALMVQQYMNNHRKYAAACGYTEPLKARAQKGSRARQPTSIDDIIDEEVEEGPQPGSGEDDEDMRSASGSDDEGQEGHGGQFESDDD